MASSTSSSSRVMEKPNQELLQQQQEALKCPRCDSSNTKFCYYNNYSLSQPRHFCKACKRYWTRGGTLRNVPVGGGCRKNKRMKRPTTSDTHTAAPSSSASAPTSASASNPPSQPQIDVASTSNHINPLFYGMNIPYPRFNSSSTGYDHLQPQMNSSLGLDFTDNAYRNGFSSNNTLLSSYNSSSIFGNSTLTSTTTPSTTTTPVMASLLNTTLQQQKFINTGVNSIFPGFAPLEELAIAGNSSSTHDAEMVALKEVKSIVEGENRFLGWPNNQIDQHHVGLSDPSSLYWNAATSMSGTAWNDQTNIGPSVTSLI